MAYGSSRVHSYKVKEKKKDISSVSSIRAGEKNRGGLLSGLGYVGGSIAAGVGGIGEGIIDLLSAGGALLTGDVDYAKYVFKDNVVGDWHEELTNEFNPGTGWKFAGDVASGIGQSATLFIPYAGAPLFFAGVMSQGISGAAAKTGDVGLKEVAYGVTSGAIEGTLEMALGAAGKGAKSIASSAAKSLGKNSVKGLAKSAVRKGVAGKLLSGAAGEFVEEAISEAIDPMIQRLYQIDPNASASMKDVLYAGLVGAVSGAVTTGAVEIHKSASNRARGAKVIRNGNSQTLVNSATILADRLAGAGTDFKNAPEWVRTLRGEINAYNELVKNGKQDSASAETILGEMQASVGFAEMQAINAGITAKIKSASEADRAALAEYINMTVDAKNRPKTYTAEDIAKDTDGVATQLAIMEFAGSAFDIDGAMGVSGDVAQESAIASVIAKESGEAPSAKSRVPNEAQSETDPAFEQAMARAEATAAEAATAQKNADDGNKAISTAKRAEATAKLADKVKRAASSIAVEGKLYKISDADVKAIADRAEELIVSGVSEVDAISRAVDEKLVGSISLLNAGNRIETVHAKDRIKKVKGAIINEYRKQAQGEARRVAAVEKQKILAEEAAKKEASERESEKEPSKYVKVNGRIVPNKAAKTAQKSGEASKKAVESKAQEKGAEAKNKAEAAKKKAQTDEQKISQSKEAQTDEQRAERAKARAEAWIEWEKNTRPTAKELNTVREYVKGFDNLSNPRRLAIIRMIRSAKGVDEQTVKGIANLMAVIPGSDLEVRFSDGIGPKGLKTKVGNKTVIILDSSTDRKNTIKGTIAHELTHYLENKAGYEQLAKFARDHAKPEAIERHKNRYIKFWNEIGHDYTQAELDSEITASLVADALNNERFLKRYADRDKTILQRAGSWLKTLVTRLKNKGKETEEVSKIADEMAHKLIVLLQSDKTTGESKSGVKYDSEANKKITIGMSDSDRAEVLKNTKLEVVVFKDETDELSNEEVIKLRDTYKSQAEKIVRTLAKKFGVFADYSNENIDLEFNYSSRSLGESVHKQNDRVLDKSHADFSDFAKMLYVFDDVVKCAQPIEAHSDKYVGTKRANSNLKQTYILLSAFEEGKYIVPVEFNIKEFSNGDKNKLYVSVTLQKIEVDLMEHPPQLKTATKNSKPTSTYSITDILKNVNPRDKYFLKYIPDSLLDHEQIKAKNEALEEDRIRLDDMRYEYAVENNPNKANEMLSEKAKAMGYSPDSKYQGSLAFNGAAPSVNAYFLTKEERKEAFENDEFEGDYSLGDFVDNGLDGNDLEWQLNNHIAASGRDRATLASLRNLSNTVRQGKRTIKMYRAVDAKIKEMSFRNGDWVTPSREYAERHIGLQDWENGRIIEQEVSIDDIWWNGDDINEWGYDNGNTNQIYKNTANNVKTLEVTYDDDGNLIPISKRYDDSVTDVRYDLADDESDGKAEKSSERGTSARKSATVASEYAGRYAGSFRLNSAARKKVEEELEGIENDFVKGGEGYTEKYQKRVRRIWDTIKTYGSFELISEDENFREFSRYMFRKKFRVDKRFREEMGAEWKELYKALRGRIAADTNTKYSHIDTFYAELSEQFPDMFPKDIVNIHDQLDRIAKIIGESKNSPTSEFTYDQLPDEMQAAVNVDVIDMINSFVTKIASNRDVVNRLKKENEALVKRTLSMRNKMARERAENAKNEQAQVFAKKDVKIAVDSIEGWTQEEVLSLAKGQELQGMSRAKREEMISQIYVALHEEGAKGRVGPGSVAVKTFAAEIANDYLDSAQIKGADGKSVHLGEIYDELSINRFKQELTDLLYGEFANMGQTTQNAEFQAIIRAQKESFLQDQLNDKLIGRETRNLAYQGKKLRELVENQKRDGAAEDISKVTKRLAAVVDAKGNIRVNAVDEAMKEASRFFDAEKMKAESAKNMLKTSDGKETQALSDFAWEQNEELKFMIDEYVRLRRGREGRALSTEELKLAAEVLRGMKTTLERYNKEFINGHWVDVDEAAKACVADLTAAWRDKEYKNKAAEILGGTVDWFQEKYFYKILTPETVVETLEGYAKSGILKQLYHSIRVHKQRAEHLAVQMKKPLAEFIDSKDNRYTDKNGREHSFRKKLNEKQISIDGANITLGEAIYLYMLTKREEAHAGLLENGYIVFDDKNQRRAAIAIPDIETVRSNIYNQLDKTDIEFLKLSEDFFNKTASKIKHDADMNIFGYTNIREGYYVPMIRDRYSRMNGVTDARQSIGSIITVYNKSFNQNLVENARALEGKNIMSIISDHADGLADYAELYLPLKAFDRTYNRAVGTSNGSIRSIREVLNNDVWNGTERYFKDLFADIQGQREQRDDVVNNLVGKIRSGWVNSVLGANLKVVATQTTSLVSATQVIGAKYIAKCSYLASPGKIPGLAEIRARAYEYSDIIEARSFDMGALKSQGNVDKINAIGEKTGWAIGWMDERICLAVFHAAELQIQDQQGYAVGTPENAERAARLADEAIYTTQAMSSASERSALQRSTNEIGKMLAMFTSDTVKNLSHLYGNINKWNAYKARVKSGDVSYEAEMKKAGKDIRRSVRTLACTGIMLGLIAQGFKYLYGREEEEPEDKQRDFIADIAGSTLNILPIVSDIADKLFFDYDMSLNVLDVANDTLEAVSGTFKMAGNMMKGEYVSTKQITKNSINVVKSVGSFFGLPITPVERTVSGLLRFVSPEAAYSYNSNFGAQSYTSDLQAAVESGDERLAEHVLEQLYRNEIAGVYTSAELEEIVRLYGLTDDDGKHYNVLPQKIGTEINGVVLNKAQRKQFEKVYSQASAEVNKLIRSEYYQELNDEQRAKAIKNLYALYYNRAASEVTGAEWTRAQAYSLLTDNYSALFAAQAYRSGLEATKDASGKEVTVKAQFVDYMKKLGLSESDYVVIAYANSVRDKQTRAALLAHINSLALSDEQKAKLAETLGFEVKNGKVVEKEE